MSTLPGRDHMSSSSPSLDGKGGTDSDPKVGKSTKRTGPNYGLPYLETRLCFDDLIASCSILPPIH
jgi:hypothetical protein